MPHADREFKQNLKRSGVAAVSYPRGSHGEMRRCIWCSGSPRDWMTIWRSLQKVTRTLETKEQVLELIGQNDARAICEVLR